VIPKTIYEVSVASFKRFSGFGVAVAAYLQHLKIFIICHRRRVNTCMLWIDSACRLPQHVVDPYTVCMSLEKKQSNDRDNVPPFTKRVKVSGDHF